MRDDVVGSLRRNLFDDSELYVVVHVSVQQWTCDCLIVTGERCGKLCLEWPLESVKEDPIV